MLVSQGSIGCGGKVLALAACDCVVVASALKVGVDCFFEGLPEPTLPDEATAQAARREPVTDFLHTAEGQALASQFLKISRPRVRRHVLDLVRALAHDEPPDQ